MTIKAVIKGVDGIEIDIVNLFIHEKYDCGPLSEEWVANQVAARLNATCDPAYNIDVLSPSESGLSRFVLTAGEHTYTERCYTATALRNHWPKGTFDALRGVGCLRWTGETE